MSALNREIVCDVDLCFGFQLTNSGIFKGTCEMVSVILTTVHIILGESKAMTCECTNNKSRLPIIRKMKGLS